MKIPNLFLQTVADIRSSLLQVAGVSSPEWSAVLLQVHNHSISQLISAKERQTDESSKVLFLPRAAARTLLKLFFRRRAHEKERGFWSWPMALMGGGWLGFVRCSFEEKMEEYFAQVAGIPCDLRLSPETRPVGEDEVRR